MSNNAKDMFPPGLFETIYCKCLHYLNAFLFDISVSGLDACELLARAAVEAGFMGNMSALCALVSCCGSFYCLVSSPSLSLLSSS